MIFLAGLLTGMVFGFFLKRSRFCMTGLIRDIYFLKKPYHFLIIASIIATEGLLYYAMGHAGLILIPSYLPPFSLLAVALGSLLFGIGAVLANGCLTSTLIKCGDGRVIGFLILVVFMIVGYFMSAGPGRHLTRLVRTVTVVSDDLPVRRQPVMVMICAAAAIICWVAMAWHHKKHKPKFAIPSKYHGVRHILCEKIWPIEVGAVCIGAWLGLTYLISEQFGRHNSFTIATPILSWLYTPLHPYEVIGGCNPADQTLGFASMLVLGIVAGVFVTSLVSREFAVVKPAKGTILKAVIGAVLMGIGAIWGTGCLVSNGLVGTAQGSVKSWFALLFLALGIWLATRIFLMRED